MVAILPMSELVAMPERILSAFIALRSGLSSLPIWLCFERPFRREALNKLRRQSKAREVAKAKLRAAW